MAAAPSNKANVIELTKLIEKGPLIPAQETCQDDNVSSPDTGEEQSQQEQVLVYSEQDYSPESINSILQDITQKIDQLSTMYSQLNDTLSELAKRQDRLESQLQDATVLPSEQEQASTSLLEAISARLESMEQRLCQVEDNLSSLSQRTNEQQNQESETILEGLRVEIDDRFRREQDVRRLQMQAMDTEIQKLTAHLANSADAPHEQLENLSHEVATLRERVSICEESLQEANIEHAAAKACARILREEILKIQQG